MCGKYSLLWLYQSWLSHLWWTQAEETFVPYRIFQLIIYICTSGRVCVDKWDHLFLWDIFLSCPENDSSPSVLSRRSTTTIEPRAFPLIWCLQSSVCSRALQWYQLQGLVQLESVAFPSSDNMRCFQASLAGGPGFARTRKTNISIFFFLCTSLNMREKHDNEII